MLALDMIEIPVELGERRYSVSIGHGSIELVPELLGPFTGRRIVVVAGQRVWKLHGRRVGRVLRKVGRIETITVPDGERYKSRTSLNMLHDRFLASGLARDGLVVAVGGGVVGDLAGLAAATYMRGLDWIPIPTTLLSMVDSSIGGKVGINHPLAKNLIGAFHQPRLVLSDTSLLATLPPRELRAGWAEVIKHAVIRDAGLFQLLEAASSEFKVPSSELPDNATQNSKLKTQNFAELVRQAAKVKVDVVNIDERETGERMLLNYGHTLGHALEALTGYGTLLHGEAVAIGMELAAQVALRMELWGPDSVERQRALLHAYGLPTTIPAGVDPTRLLELTLRDKKVRAGRVRWVLPTAIGAAEVHDDVPEDLVRAVVVAAGAG